MSLGKFLETGNFRDFLRKSPLPILKPIRPEIDLFPGFHPFYVRYMTGYNDTPKFSKQKRYIYSINDRGMIESQLTDIRNIRPTYAFDLFVENEYQEYVSFLNLNSILLKILVIWSKKFIPVAFDVWKNSSDERRSKAVSEIDPIISFEKWKEEYEYENYVDYITDLNTYGINPVLSENWLKRSFFIKAELLLKTDQIKKASFTDFEAASLVLMNDFRKANQITFPPEKGNDISIEDWKNNGHYFRNDDKRYQNWLLYREKINILRGLYTS